MIHASPEVIYEYLYKPGELIADLAQSESNLKTEKRRLLLVAVTGGCTRCPECSSRVKANALTSRLITGTPSKTPARIDSLITWTLRAKNNRQESRLQTIIKCLNLY